MSKEIVKIAYNNCYGGFSLSVKASERIAELKGDILTEDDFRKLGSRYCHKYNYISRTDPHLIQVIEELGDEANGMCAKLRIEELSKGTLYRIDEYDGNESIRTQDCYEWSVA